MSRIGAPRPDSCPTMLRRPPPIGTKRPPGSAARRNSAARRCAAEPAGRGPSATWRRAHFIARSASKRSTFAAGTAGTAGLSVSRPPASAGCEAVVDAPLSSSPPNRSPSAPVAIAMISAPASSSWTARTTTSGRRRRAELIVRGDGGQQVGEALAGGLAPRRHVLGRDVVGRRLVPAQDLAGDGRAVDLVRAVVEPGAAGVAVHGLERQVGGV